MLPGKFASDSHDLNRNPSKTRMQTKAPPKLQRTNTPDQTTTQLPAGLHSEFRSLRAMQAPTLVATMCPERKQYFPAQFALNSATGYQQHFNNSAGPL